MNEVSNNLPLQLSSFIGREREICEVKPLLSTARLVTLTGIGGGGKTRLALQVAPEVLDNYQDGVWFVELAPLSDPALVPQTVANALGMREEPGRPLQATLIDWLRPKHLLLVLDNCEHLIAACAQLADMLLRACPHLNLLATSREALNVAGEHIYLVPSLETDPAVRLFIERAMAAHARFTRDDRNVNVVAQICQRLDGIPLAIELAAARIKALPVDKINERLDKRFNLLTGGSRTALPRQQTLRAAIDWSYDLLSAAEQILLRRLSVFAGGWTLEAAETVCAAIEEPAREAGLGQIDVLDLLTHLVDKSLVLVEEKRAGGRYRMLETIREYAHEKLLELGETGDFQIRHLEFFLSLAEQTEPKIHGADQLLWLDRLDADHDNLRVALQWTQSSYQTARGVRLAAALIEFWHVRGHAWEGHLWFEGFLTQPLALERTVTRAKALWGAGKFAVFLGDSAQARTCLEESVSIWREVGDEQGLAYALRELGYTFIILKDLATARLVLDESVRLLRKLGDFSGLAYGLRFLGHESDQVYATRCLEESLRLFRDLKHPKGIGMALLGLAEIAIEQGNYAIAKAYLEESLLQREIVRDELGVAGVSQSLGAVALLEDNCDQATACYTKALAIYEKLGYKLNVAEAVGFLGHVALCQGDQPRALMLLRQSLTLNQELAYAPGITENLVSLTRYVLARGDLSTTVRLCGAVNAQLQHRGFRLDAVHRAAYDRSIHFVRTRLNAVDFAQALDEGQEMTLDEATAFALQKTAESAALSSTPTPQSAEAGPVQASSAALLDELTSREIEVLRLVAQGLTDAQIAETLVVSTRTVHGHLRAIYSKLDVTNRTAAARYAAEFKLR